jgi:SNF2 family DNA or RNA helicase
VPTNSSASTGFAALVTPSAYVTAKKAALRTFGRRWKPHKYQLKAVKYLVERAAAALLLDPGLGKTSISLAALKLLKNAGLFQGALVVAPRRVAVSVWPQEQQEWEDFHDLSMTVLHGDHKDDRAMVRKDVYVINYEGLAWLIKKGHLQRMLKDKWLNVLIIDELSKVKHIDSGRHKALAAWSHLFAYRWGLTGSPASNGLLDIFGQMFILDFGKALGQFFTHFRWNFFYPTNTDSDYPVWLPKPGAKELIYEQLKPIALRMDARKHVKMPELVTVPLRLELDDKTRKVYDAMELEFFSVLDNSDLITAPTAAAAGMKCRQIATGAVYEDRVDPLTGIPRTGARKWNWVHDNKIEALKDLVEELQGQPLMIVYQFGHDLARIQKMYPNIPFIGGGVSDKKSLAYETSWNNNEFPLMAVHPQAVGHGLNFQKGGAHHLFFFTPDYDYEVYDQMIRRLMRQGNTAERVFVHMPVTADTVEVAVAGSLRSKRRTQDEFLLALEDYREARRKRSG